MIITRPQSDKEHDLLVNGIEANALVIKDLDGSIVKTIEPDKNGWTHDSLESIDYYSISPDGWDAYLAHQWIGSSEV